MTDYHATIERLADASQRRAAFAELARGGEPALAAAREGLSHPNWEVRRWCAAHMDHHADSSALERLALTLEDPKAKVRLWAVHSIACEPCKPGQHGFDVVPLILKRLRNDKAVRVRRMAALMLAMRTPDRRIARAFRRRGSEEQDAKVLKHMQWGLDIHNGKVHFRQSRN